MNKFEKELLINELAFKGESFVRYLLIIIHILLYIMYAILIYLLSFTLKGNVPDLITGFACLIFSGIYIIHIFYWILDYSRKHFIILWSQRLKKKVNDLDIIIEIENKAKEIGFLKENEKVV